MAKGSYGMLRRGRGMRILIFTILAQLLFILFALPSLAMQLFLKCPDDSHIAIEVEPTDRIEDIRARILDEQGLEADEYDLMYANKLLLDGNTLQDYSVQKDATLHIRLHEYQNCACIYCGREIEHSFDGCEDTDCNNENCTQVREGTPHAFDGCEDADCNNEGCAYIREAKHIGGEATCTDKATCTACGKAYGELLPHTPSENWLVTETHHYHKCESWDEYNSCKQVFDYAEHSYGEWVITKESGYFELGEKQRECVCGHTQTESVQMKSILDEPIGKREILVAGAVAVGMLMLWGIAHYINRP